MVKFLAHRREPILAYQLLGYIYHLYPKKVAAVSLDYRWEISLNLKNGWY